jgi:hypothetical protein
MFMAGRQGIRRPVVRNGQASTTMTDLLKTGQGSCADNRTQVSAKERLDIAQFERALMDF